MNRQQTHTFAYVHAHKIWRRINQDDECIRTTGTIKFAKGKNTHFCHMHSLEMSYGCMAAEQPIQK